MTARRRNTPAKAARRLHALNPALTPTQLAARIGSTRQAVEAALAVTHKRTGRPSKAPTKTIRINVEWLPRIEADAARDGVSVREWIEDAIAVRLLKR